MQYPLLSKRFKNHNKNSCFYSRILYKREAKQNTHLIMSQESRKTQTYTRGILPPFKPQLTEAEIQERLNDLDDQRFSAHQMHGGRLGNITIPMD